MGRQLILNGSYLMIFMRILVAVSDCVKYNMLANKVPMARTLSPTYRIIITKQAANDIHDLHDWTEAQCSV